MENQIILKGKNKAVLISKEKDEAMKAWWNQYVKDNSDKNLIKVGKHYISHEKNEAMKAWLKQKKFDQGKLWENACIEKERLEQEERKRINKERIRLEQEERERIRLEQEERERINKERIRLEQEERERINKERIRLEQEEMERKRLEEEKKQKFVRVGRWIITQERHEQMLELYNEIKKKKEKEKLIKIGNFYITQEKHEQMLEFFKEKKLIKVGNNYITQERHEQMKLWYQETLEKSKEKNKVKLGNVEITESKNMEMANWWNTVINEHKVNLDSINSFIDSNSEDFKENCDEYINNNIVSHILREAISLSLTSIALDRSSKGLQYLKNNNLTGNFSSVQEMSMLSIALENNCLEKQNKVFSLLQDNGYYLFHKYLLGIESVSNNINYDLIHNNISEDFKNNKYYAHLHCFDISRFDEIYGEYIDKISEYFSIIITYSIGDNSIQNERFVVLKIPNKGMDIGGKFCAVRYLNDNNIQYDYILFLHSKSNLETRKKYFEPLINNLDDEFIQNINENDGYFPDIKWEIVGDKINWVPNYQDFKNYENKNLPERNNLYRNEFLKYCKATNNTNQFIEGNCFILSKKVIDKLYTDPLLYNILNTDSSFDYNWVINAYDIKGNIYKVYKQFTDKNLLPRNQTSFDGYFEHVFERVVLNFCDNYKIIRPPKICIIYVYYEKKNEQKNQTNLSFFIKYGLDKSRWRDMDITTLFIINGKQCEVLIPEREDLFILKQDNCSDVESCYNGIQYFEDKYKKSIYDLFTHLCLINASSFGPVYEDNKDRHWLEETIFDKKYYIHNIKPSKDDDNMKVLNRYNNVTFGKFDEQFLKLKLEYDNAIIDISNYKECFNKKYKKCLIYAHFDEDNLIKNYVIESLIIFSQIGYDIVFYTTSTSINNYDESFLPFKINYVSPFLKSGGDDWFMWLNGCKKLKQYNEQYKWIMLLNDSMIVGINGIYNMEKSINNMENKDIDFWGHWDSNEITYHIMSSLYEFKYELLDHFIKFTETNLFACKSKHEVVLKCETKFTTYLQCCGFKTSSIINKDSYPFQPPEIFRYNVNNVINCPSHNPLNISSWINNEFSFGIKWKYILCYLKECNLNNDFKERLRHIHIHMVDKYLGTICHFPLIPVNLYRDNNIFGNEKKILTIVNFKQKYVNAEKIQFL